MKCATSTEIRQVRRGTLKAFREYLNAKTAGGTLHSHGPYHQTKRAYGDYLYHQDRAKFDFELIQWRNGTDHQDFANGQ